MYNCDPYNVLLVIATNMRESAVYFLFFVKKSLLLFKAAFIWSEIEQTLEKIEQK